MREITSERTQGSDWIVTAGLKEGDRVITQGLGKIKAGQKIKPVPENAPQRPRGDDGKDGAKSAAPRRQAG